jgi:hypothetical protein
MAMRTRIAVTFRFVYQNIPGQTQYPGLAISSCFLYFGTVSATIGHLSIRGIQFPFLSASHFHFI